jgi:hypothetical protein
MARHDAVVRDWPPITDPGLLERLALDDDEFKALVREMATSFGGREMTPELLERALRYPWKRPEGSYVMRGGEVQVLGDLAPGEREQVIRAFARERHPILAIGSNAAPGVLEIKFAHFPGVADREVLVLTGVLHDLDVGPAATLTLYGSMPAALFSSPGTAVRAALVWVTPAQLMQLTWSELSYRLGRLDAARFEVDEAHIPVEHVLGYVNRFGVLHPDGEPVALDAVPATGRRAVAVTQEELLARFAPLLLGPGAGVADLVRAIYEDMGAVVARASEHVWPLGRQLAPELWTPYPAQEG